MTSGWATTTIGEACSVFSGGTPSKANDSYWRGDIPWVSAKDLKSDQIFDAELHISAEACTESAAKMAPVGSLLVLVRGMGLANGVPIGEVTSPVAFNQDIRAIVPPKGLNSRFLQLALRYAFTSSPKLLSSAAHGTLKIDAEALRTVSFPVPTQTEQQCIVAILDEAFEGIATAKANAEKNLQNAIDLVQSHLDAELSHHGVGYIETTLGQEVELLPGYAFPSKGYTEETADVRLLRGDNIMQGYLRWEEAKRWPTDDCGPYSRFALAEGDVVLAMDRPWVKAGLKRAQISSDDLPCLLVQRTARLRPKQRLLKDFLFQLTGSPLFSRHLLSVQTGIGVPHISGKQIESFRFMRPPLEAQAAIAANLTKLQMLTETLVENYAVKLAALDELKQSLLHQAFSGQLTSSKQTSIRQQPELQTTTPEFTANVISIAHARHERLKREKTFGRVKEQKTLHLIESIAGIDLGRQPMRDAAGPNDFQHMLKAEEWAQAHGFFEMVKTGEGYEFRKLSKFDEHMSHARQTLAPYLSRLEPVIDLLVPLDKEEAEVFATVHAAWNNLLIDGVQATDDAIVLAARQDWHPDKLKIQEHKFRIAIETIRQKKLVPTGSAKYVGGQKALFEES